MIRWLIGSVGSSVLGSLVFAIGMMVFFPSDWVKEQVAYQVQTQTNKKMLVHIGDARSSGFMGVSLEDVSLYNSKRGRRTPGETGKPPRENTLIGTRGTPSLSLQTCPDCSLEHWELESVSNSKGRARCRLRPGLFCPETINRY